MSLKFDKIHACGNDFLLLGSEPDPSWIAPVCDRHHGMGADGLMIFKGLENGRVSLGHFDPDGSRSFCLNGTRSAIFCLASKGLIPASGEVETEGVLMKYRRGDQGEIQVTLPKSPYQRLVWQDENDKVEGFLVDVGNPQFIPWTSDHHDRDLVLLAPKIRKNSTFFPSGTNVTWVFEQEPGRFRVRSFERGVEAMTKACGSGMLAAGLVLFGERGLNKITFIPDGLGEVELVDEGSVVSLSGGARWVGEGVWFCGV